MDSPHRWHSLILCTLNPCMSFATSKISAAAPSLTEALPVADSNFLKAGFNLAKPSAVVSAPGYFRLEQ